MLVEVNTLKIENRGYKRIISMNKMYINSNSVVSITDYEGASNFLLKEQSQYSNDKFSLIKLNEGGTVKELIAFGTAAEVFSSFGEPSSGKRILNG